MNKFIALCAATLVLPLFAVTEVIDTYDFKMVVKVPRIYDNTTSQGYRKYQTQRIQGTMTVTYKEGEERPIIKFTNMVNLTHKINGKNVTYKVALDEDGYYVFPRWNVIGDNKKDVFKTPSVAFYLDCEPSYNVGEDEPDNSLLITCSGSGTTAVKTDKIYDCCTKKYIKRQYRVIRSLTGFLAGTLGCGCRAYGHKSPTRVMGAYDATDMVDDVGAVYGKWAARIRSRVEK